LKEPENGFSIALYSMTAHLFTLAFTSLAVV